MKNSQEKNKEYAKGKKTLFLKQIAITAAICFSTIGGNANFPDNKDKLIEKNTIDLREAIIKKSLEYIKNDIKDSMLYDPFCMYTIYYSNAFFEKTKESKKDNHYIFNQINKNLSQENKKEIISYIDNYFLQNNLEQSSNKEVLPLNIIDFGKSSTEKNSHQDAIDLYSQVGTSIQSMSDGIVLVAEKGWTKENIFSTSSYKGGNTIIIYNPKNSSFYRYAHLKDIFVETGSIITSGTILGTIGKTGENAIKNNSHLHLEINYYNKETGETKITNRNELKKRLLELKKISTLHQFL